MSATVLESQSDPRVTKFGARWVVEGPEGRFHARTKTEGLRLLAEADERARGRVFYTVTWNYIGGDCGDMPMRFATEDEADFVGQCWAAKVLADLQMREPALHAGDDGTPTYRVHRHDG